MQQPSAIVDEIIVAWSLEDLSSRFPQAVLQRDLLSGALSSRARVASYLQQILECWVGPGMTPVVQVTDTDVAYVLKRLLAKFKVQAMREMKDLALKEGRGVSFKMGAKELLEVCANAVREFKSWADKGDLTLKALRRNGQLAYICKDGKLVELTKEVAGWVETIGDLGSHRYPTSWLADRFSWLDEQGVPKTPNWLEVMTPSEKKQFESHKPDSKETDKEKEIEYQKFLQQKLGIRGATNGER